MGSSQLLFILGAVIGHTVRAAVLSFPPQNSSDLASDVQSIANRDVRYDKWVEPGRILYRFDDHAYSSDEKSLIVKAMEQVGQDLNHCINFREYNPDSDAGWDNIYISKTLNDGSVPPTCFSFYGRVLRAAGQGQKMAVHAGPNGCMDSQREVMKIMVNVLGLRNEYNRPDRDQFIKVYPESLQAELRHSNLLSAYNASQVDTVNRPFDYHSITIPVANKYGIENSTVFEFPANHTLPHLDRLSLDDCLGLSWMYGCDAKKCVDPYGLPTPIVKEEAVSEIKNESSVKSEAAVNSEASVKGDAAQKILIELNATAAPVLASSQSSSEAASSSQANSEVVPSSSAAALLISSTPQALESSSALPEVPSSSSVPEILSSSVASESSSAASEVVSSSSSQLPAETSATMLLTLATSAPPLNISLVDVINPRKGAVAEQAVTEAPMLINTEVSASTSQAPASSSSEDTTSANHLKFVFVANQSESGNSTILSIGIALVNSSQAPVEANQSSSAVPVVGESTVSPGINSAETSSRLPVAPEETITAVAVQPLVNLTIVSGDTLNDFLNKAALNATAVDANNVVSVQNNNNNTSGVIDSVGSPVVL